MLFLTSRLYLWISYSRQMYVVFIVVSWFHEKCYDVVCCLFATIISYSTQTTDSGEYDGGE